MFRRSEVPLGGGEFAADFPVVTEGIREAT
jgi:hypothetical protein